ncbi:MAG: hypothetical protein EXS05_10760 [Planctomycetaceae bacterium]|nr:hypothetical protein [Planctomycetaceae bacterium]
MRQSACCVKLSPLSLLERRKRPPERLFHATIPVQTGGSRISCSINVVPDTLEDEVEPFLLRCGLIQRTPRGRVATAAAFAHLKLLPPATDGGPGQSLLF